MPRVRYTVLAVSRGADEPAPFRRPATGDRHESDGMMSTWLVTLSDQDGKRHLLTLAQPSERANTVTVGQVLELDARLLSESAGAGAGAQG